MKSKKKHLYDLGKGHISVCGVKTYSATHYNEEVTCEKCVEQTVKIYTNNFDEDMLYRIFNRMIKKIIR